MFAVSDWTVLFALFFCVCLRCPNGRFFLLLFFVGDVRAILSRGWSSRMEKDPGPEIDFPREVHAVRDYLDIVLLFGC